MNNVVLVAGLGYGDEGKGSTVDFLATRSDIPRLVVRYNGGCQAGHNVSDETGKHHTFSQFGSGTFAGAPTLLSRYMFVNPVTLVPEAKHLTELGIPNPYNMLHVERDAVVTTPYHAATNRLREMARGHGKHGSCGMGVGETATDWTANKYDALYVRDLSNVAVAGKKLRALRDRMIENTKNIEIKSAAMADEIDLLKDEDVVQNILHYFKNFVDNVNIVDRDWLHKQPGTVIFEGAQGVLLDQDFGFQPYTTWSDCTFGNAYKLLDVYKGDVLRLGVLRSYMTRHGAGPFVTEDTAFDSFSEKDHNVYTEWQNGFRSGAFDCIAAKYALDVIGGVDGLVLTHMDKITSVTPVCINYYDGIMWTYSAVHRPANYERQRETADTLLITNPVYTPFGHKDYANRIAERIGVQLYATSHGPCAKDKQLVSK